MCPGEPEPSPVWHARTQVEPLVLRCLQEIALARGCRHEQLSVGEYEACLNLALTARRQAISELTRQSGVIPATRDPFDEETPSR